MSGKQYSRARIDYSRIASAALTCGEGLCRHWLPDGRTEGHEWVALNPKRVDRRLGSFKVNLTTGMWAEFAKGKVGGDLISLAAYLYDLSQGDAALKVAEMLRDAGHLSQVGNGSGKTKKSKRQPEWTSVAPVPDDAPAPPDRHPQLGKPLFTWRYLDATGKLQSFVARFEVNGDGKTFRPLSLFVSKGGEHAWRWQSAPEPRPLYHLEKLAAAPTAVVVVCEGEKSADAAAELLGEGFVTVASPAGAQSAAKANWQPLSGRHVVIWRDADEPGRAYAEEVTKLASVVGAASVRAVTPPTSVAVGWDAADALIEGWTRQEALDLMRAAKGSGADHAENVLPAGQIRQRSAGLIDQAMAESELWHTPGKEAYVTWRREGQVEEHFALDSPEVEDWLAELFYETTGGPPPGQMLSEVRRVLRFKARREGLCYTPQMRTAEHNGNILMDLGRGRSVLIDGAGWRIVDTPSAVKFVRSPNCVDLAEPEPGGKIDEMVPFLNCDEEDRPLALGWIVNALWPRARTYPILVLSGEQGAGKSTAARVIRGVTDPSTIPSVSPPREERDLFATAIRNHVISFDNLSRLDHWFSDALCRLATGGGYSGRTLGSNLGLTTFTGARPLILNGIPDFAAHRQDLGSRALTVHLRSIEETSRRTEEEFWADFELARPRILGAICDALSAALRRFGSIKLKRKPRMADFVHVVSAAGAGFGWDDDFFARVYEDNRMQVSVANFEADPVAAEILKFLQKHCSDRDATEWEGTATDLLGQLNGMANDDRRRSKYWPDSAQGIGTAVTRATPVLRANGVDVHRGRARDSTKLITFKLR